MRFIVFIELENMFVNQNLMKNIKIYLFFTIFLEIDRNQGPQQPDKPHCSREE